ncbi:Phosphohistidine phosphatase/mutase (fragment) [groundwater metagenome]|uniref:Phosphohistidine phosphatase/mutase n=1 Tax=groundwater metagenome TaxID=717931 RepID=A0A098E6K4_9ZZZZ
MRELSEKGKKQAKKVGKTLKNSDTKISEIFLSPLKRATRTAEIIAKELDNPEIKITELLNPLSNPDEILNHLNYLNKDKILMVGHQPFLGKMFASQTHFIDLKKG